MDRAEGLLCDDPNVNARADRPARLRLDGYRIASSRSIRDDNPTQPAITTCSGAPGPWTSERPPGFASVWRTERDGAVHDTWADAPRARNPARAVAPSRLEVLSTVPARLQVRMVPQTRSNHPAAEPAERPGRRRLGACAPLRSNPRLQLRRTPAEVRCRGEPYLERSC